MVMGALRTTSALALCIAMSFQSNGLRAADDGKAKAAAPVTITATGPATDNPVFPVIQCAFDINFMNSGDRTVSKVCPHIQSGASYRAILTNGSIQADAAVVTGSFFLKANDKQAKVAFSIAGKDGVFTWTAPGSIVLGTKVGPDGAIATLAFDGKGCSSSAGDVNCAIQGIPRLIEEPAEVSCIFRLGGFCWTYGSLWLPQRRRSQGAHSAGA